jgi:ribose 5-phosphate isomerase A
LPAIEDAFRAIARDAAKLAKGSRTVGLGSGSSAAFVVAELANLREVEDMQFVPTSLQIKTVAEKYNLCIADESRIPYIDIVFDGADEIDGGFNMIKGGGGALLREKILISSAKQVVILADESKFVKKLSRSVPIEVHPMARSSVAKALSSLGGKPLLRTLDKGYAFVTENGNLILETKFASIDDPRATELELKNIPGVMEVGLFTRRANMYYKAKADGSFDKMTA